MKHAPAVAIRCSGWEVDDAPTSDLQGPHRKWIRGSISDDAVAGEPRRLDLPMLGLGGSVATPPGGITAEVLVASFEELERRSDEARGKIVLFDAPFTTYGKTVQCRSQGANAASRADAVASLTLPDATSRNVLGEIVGSELLDEVVVVPGARPGLGGLCRHGHRVDPFLQGLLEPHPQGSAAGQLHRRDDPRHPGMRAHPVE
jgi:hypothetical protein